VAVFAGRPDIKIVQERLKSGGYAKVAFVGREVVGKFSMPANGERRGWVS